MKKKLTKKDELMREAGLLIGQLAQVDGIKTIDGIHQLTAGVIKQTLERILEVKKKKSLATRNNNTRKRQDRTAVTEIEEDTKDKNGIGRVRYTEGSTRGV
jgi:hypothetical protein